MAKGKRFLTIRRRNKIVKRGTRGFRAKTAFAETLARQQFEEDKIRQTDSAEFASRPPSQIVVIVVEEDPI